MSYRLAPALSVLAVMAFLLWLGRSVGDVRHGSVVDENPAPTVAPPCLEPVTWRLADVDPRFGVSREWVLGAAREGARMWGSIRGVPLLAEEADGTLGIRLVYDHRQPLLEGGSPVRFEAAVYREVVSTVDSVPDRHFREIRVFAFRDRVDLVQILAHELGHALGLAHPPDSGAVMSAEQVRAELSRRPVALQASDRRALEDLCATPVASPATR